MRRTYKRCWIWRTPRAVSCTRRASAFAANILHGTPLIANGQEGLNGVLLSNAMHFSCFLGRPIRFPYDEKLYFNELQKRVATSRRKDNVKTVVADTSSSFAGAK